LAFPKGSRRQLIDPKIAENRGGIIMAMADGALIEFRSAADAVRTAGEIGVMITFPSSNNCAYIKGLVVTVDAGLSADHEFFT
jgi:hypothetical protein